MKPELLMPVTVELTMRAMLVGLLFTFFMMRAFHFHQHGEVDETSSPDEHQHGHVHVDDTQHHTGEHQGGRRTKLGWIGVIFGLGLHTLMDGVALGAIVLHDMNHHSPVWTPAGFGVYLAILLHKPLDALSISTLMGAEQRSWVSIQCANACFGLMCPVGALIAVYFGPLAGGGFWLGCLLAGAAGVFLCISLSDLLPEVQFHRHDRVQLSGSLILGIGIAFVIEFFHPHGP
jgi:zinc and cadmium transporter